jgi:hypothetical protein
MRACDDPDQSIKTGRDRRGQAPARADRWAELIRRTGG